MGLRILVASLIPTHPTIVGNRARILALCQSLKDLGHELHFAYAPLETGNLPEMAAFFGASHLHVGDYRPTPALSGTLARFKRKVLSRVRLDSAHTYGIDDWYDPGLDAFFGRLASTWHFDVVIVEYAFLSRALTFFDDKTTKIIDTHDRFSDRHLIFMRKGQPPGWFSTTVEQEMKGLRRANIVIAIEERENRFFSQHLPDQRVITVGHIARQSPPITDWSDRIAGSILLVGTDNSPNRAAARHLLDELLPRLRKRNAATQLLFAGSICSVISDQPGIIKLGVVPDIADAYAKTWCAVNPVHVGSGQSIKSIEALGFAIPLVTTVTGARGLPDAAEMAFLKFEDHDTYAMADALARLIGSPTERTRLSQLTGDYVRRWNSSVLQSLASALPGQPQRQNQS